MCPSSRDRQLPIFRFLFLVSLGLLCCGQSVAQQPKVPAPHQPVAPKMARHREWDPPAMAQSATGALWMTDGNSKSTLYLNNMLKEDSLTVTPILHLANGVAYALTPVTLEPSGTASIDINQSLANRGVAPYATLSGYVEVQYKWGWAAICGSVWNVDTTHSLIFVYGLRQPPPVSAQGSTPAVQTIEGMWWKQEPGVSGFVGLSNLTGRAVSASVQTLDAANNVMATHSVTISPNGTKIVELAELFSTTALDGGVVVTWSGNPQELAVNASLEDPSVGYSARLPLARPDASAKISQDSFAELGFMNGPADPMMNFPASTTFTPYSVVRNLSEQSVTATPTLWWMQSGSAHSFALPQLTVGAHQTIGLDVPALLAAAGLKNWQGSFNLAFNTSGPAGALLLASGSVDQSNTYVFEVVPRAIGESAARGLGQWRTANGDDTMVTIWNPADEAQDFVFTLFYTGDHYLYPIHLEARATHTFNVSEIIHSGLPDSEGNVVPSGVQSGSAELAGPAGENQMVLVSMDAGIYNVRKATCSGTYCESCDGFTSLSVIDNPFAVAVAGTKQQTAKAQWNTGTNYDYTNRSNWSSSKTSVATVNAGLVSGVAVGSVTVTSTFTTSVPPYAQICWADGQPQPLCPQGGFPVVSGPGNVTPKILLGGSSGTDVTNQSQPVAVGQQIVLYASATLPSGVTVQSYSWSVSGTTVGGFNTGATNGGSYAATFNQQQTTFYWVVAALNQAVTLTLNLSDGSHPTASTTFNVSGPSNPGITAVIHPLSIVSGPLMQLGSGSTPGITFSATGTPPSGYPSSTFVWGQVLTANHLVLTINGANTTCDSGASSSSPHQDHVFPNASGTSTDDSPSTNLLSTETQVSKAVAAKMYLMWTSGLANAIPVPLGYVTWSFSGTATYNSSTGQWAVTSGNPPLAPSAFASTISFPAWSATDSNGPPQGCQ